VDRRTLLLTVADAMNRADIDELRSLLHPEVRFRAIRSEVTGDYHGHDGIRGFLADNREIFDEWHVTFDEIRELDDGRVLVCGRVLIRGLGSHVETVVPLGGIATFRDGLLADWYSYPDHESAYAEAGLDANES
jgi:ketosteroid isomerase-like protein